MRNSAFLILAILVVLSQSQADNGDLKKVIMVFRHGARYPNYDAKAPIYNTKLTADKSGQLSNVGMRQLFQLGTQIRKDYIDANAFLSPNFDTRQMYIRATDSDRTIMSAQSFMAGLYPAGTGLTIQDSILKDANKVKHLDPPFSTLPAQPAYSDSIKNAYQPVPIRTVQNQYDGALYIHGNACKNSAKWKDDSMKTKLFTDYRVFFDKEFTDFETIFKKYGFDAKTADLGTMYNWLDVLLCNQWNDFPVFDDESKAYYANQDLQHKVKAMVHLQFYLSFFQSEQQKKVIPTPFFQDLLKYVSDAHKPKFTVLSAHDTTINTVLQGLNLVSYECIIDYINNGIQPVPGKVCITEDTDFGANVIIELRVKNGKEYIMVKYNGVYQQICDQTSTACEKSDFQARINKLIVPDYDLQCGNTPIPIPKDQQIVHSEDSSSEETPGWAIALIVIFGILFAITLASALYFFLTAKKAKSYIQAKQSNIIVTV